MEEGSFSSRTGKKELAALVAVSAQQRGRVVGWLLAGGLPAMLVLGTTPWTVASGYGVGAALLLHGSATGAALLLGQWLEHRARARTVRRLALVTGPLPWEVSWDRRGLEVRNLAGRSRTPWRHIATLAVREDAVVVLLARQATGPGRGGYAFPVQDLPEGALSAWQAMVGAAAGGHAREEGRG